MKTTPAVKPSHKCRTCGGSIVRVEFWKLRTWLAQQNGFHDAGCEQIYDKLKEIEAARGQAA